MEHHFIKMAFAAFVISANFVSSLLCAEESYCPYDGDYLIRRFGTSEETSGSVRIQQITPDRIAVGSFRLNEGHYQNVIKEDSRAKNIPTPRSSSTFARLQNQLCPEDRPRNLWLNSLYEKGERNIAQYVLYKLPSVYLTMHLLNTQNNASPQYGVVETYNGENLHVRFHVEKDLTGSTGDEFSLYLEYPYCYRFLGGGISTAAPAQRINLIKIGSPRHEKLQRSQATFSK